LLFNRIPDIFPAHEPDPAGQRRFDILVSAAARSADFPHGGFDRVMNVGTDIAVEVNHRALPAFRVVQGGDDAGLCVQRVQVVVVFPGVVGGAHSLALHRAPGMAGKLPARECVGQMINRAQPISFGPRRGMVRRRRARS
jgi:hypothetical protein